MSFVNKFGESSIKHNVNSSKIRQMNNITKDIEKIYNTIKNIKKEIQDINTTFSSKIEQRFTEIEEYIFKWNRIDELKNEYDSQLNIIRRDVKVLQEMNTKEIDEDVDIILLDRK